MISSANDLEEIQNKFNSLGLQFLQPKDDLVKKKLKTFNQPTYTTTATENYSGLESSLKPPQRNASFVIPPRNASENNPPIRSSSKNVQLPSAINNTSAYDDLYDFRQEYISNSHYSHRQLALNDAVMHNYSNYLPSYLPIKNLKTCTTDVAFLLNLAGNAQSTINLLKASINRTVFELDQKYSYAEIRMAFVGFTDFGVDGLSHYLIKDFCTVTEFIIFLNENVNLQNEPFDKADDFLGGLKRTLDLSWKSKSKTLILITERPGHGEEFNNYGLHDDRYFNSDDPNGLKSEFDLTKILQKYLNLNINLYFFHLSDETLKMEAKINFILTELKSSLFGWDLKKILKNKNLLFESLLSSITISIKNAENFL